MNEYSLVAISFHLVYPNVEIRAETINRQKVHLQQLQIKSIFK